MQNEEVVNLEEAPQGQAQSARFTQTDVDRIVRERLEREKAAHEKAAAKANEQAQAQSQEWQARVAELEALGGLAARYQGALEKYLAVEKKDLPRHLLALLEKLDPVEQMEFLSANRDELFRPAATAGVPPSPQPQERSLTAEEAEQARRGQAQIYQSF